MAIILIAKSRNLLILYGTKFFFLLLLYRSGKMAIILIDKRYNLLILYGTNLFFLFYFPTDQVKMAVILIDKRCILLILYGTKPIYLDKSAIFYSFCMELPNFFR